MSDSKKYYYLKLKDNFYDSEEIKILEGMENGYKYTTLLLKLYLRSLKREGMLRINEFIPYDDRMISSVTGVDLDTVRVAISIFEKLKLIEILEDGTIYLLNIQNYIGESSTEADRIRKYRNTILENKQLLLEENNINVQMYDKRTPEIELEIEKELEIDLKIEKKTTKKGFDSIIHDYTNNEVLIKTILEFIKMRKAIKSTLTDFGLQKILIKLNSLTDDESKKVSILEQSIMNSWKGIFPIKKEGANTNGYFKPNTSEGKGKWADYKPGESNSKLTDAEMSELDLI